jgi:hypothetical protein
MVRRGTSFHANQTGRLFLEAGYHLTPPQLTTENHSTLSINTVDLKTFFARSTPIVITSFMDGSYFLGVQMNHHFGTL